MWRTAITKRNLTPHALLTAPLEEAESLPPPSRSLLRVAVGVVLIWTAILATAWGWSAYADHRLRAEHLAWQAAGLLDAPTLDARASSPPPTPSQNAAVLLVEAEDFLSAHQGALDDMSGGFMESVPWSDDDRAAVARSLVRRQHALDLVTAATTRPALRWSADTLVTPGVPSGADGLPNPWYDFDWTTSLLESAAELAAQRGDPQAFWDRLDQMQFLAAANDQRPVWSGGRQAAEIELRAAVTLTKYAHCLSLSRGSPYRPRAERLVAGWIAGDDRSLARIRRQVAQIANNAFLVERDVDVGITGRLAGDAWDHALRRAAAPATKLCAADSLTHLRADAIALARSNPQSDWATLIAGMPRGWDTVRVAAVQAEPANLLLNVYHLVSSRHYEIDIAYQALASRRMAAVSLAARLYAEDHGGAAPPTLSALVPAYLVAVPVDPFDPAGGPLRYRGPAATTRPFVYTMGQVGADVIGIIPADPPLSQHHFFDRGNVPVFLDPSTGPMPVK